MKEITPKPLSTEWILPEINYSPWLENGNPSSNVSLTVKPLTDIFLEFSSLDSPKEKKIKKPKLLMLKDLKLKKLDLKSEIS